MLAFFSEDRVKVTWHYFDLINFILNNFMYSLCSKVDLTKLSNIHVDNYDEPIGRAYPTVVHKSVNFSSLLHLLRDHWSDFFETCPRCSPGSLVVSA